MIEVLGMIALVAPGILCGSLTALIYSSWFLDKFFEYATNGEYKNLFMYVDRYDYSDRVEIRFFGIKVIRAEDIVVFLMIGLLLPSLIALCMYLPLVVYCEKNPEAILSETVAVYGLGWATLIIGSLIGGAKISRQVFKVKSEVVLMAKKIKVHMNDRDAHQ